MRALTYLATLPALFPAADITLVGDFQADCVGMTSKARLLQAKLLSHFAVCSPSTEATFCPPHDPIIHSCIDHVLVLASDPLLPPTSHSLTRLQTGFTDHVALLWHVPNTDMTFPDCSLPPPGHPCPATLLRPIPPGPLAAWATEETHLQQSPNERTTAELRHLHAEMLAHPSPHTDTALLRRLEAAAGDITGTLHAAMGRALATLPKIAARPPSRPRTGEPFWSRKFSQAHKACHRRAGIVRKLIHAFPPAPSPVPTPHLVWDCRTSALYDSLAAYTVPPDAAFHSQMVPPPRGETSHASLQALHAAHKHQAAWYATSAAQEAGLHYTEFLTKLFNHKPKKAINLILSTYSGKGQSGSLTAVCDANGLLQTAPA